MSDIAGGVAVAAVKAKKAVDVMTKFFRDVMTCFPVTLSDNTNKFARRT